MSALSRRSFVRTVGAGSVGALALPLIAARGQEALVGSIASGSGAEDIELPPFVADLAARERQGVPKALRLDSNENPNGPGAAALDAMRAMFGESSRYPDMPASDLRTAIAKRHGVLAENVVTGCGSGEILRMSVNCFTDRTRALVSAAPTFEDPAAHAQRMGVAVRAVPVDRTLRLDLAAMATSAAGAGLVFFCNPNNPTSTVHGARAMEEFVRRVLRASPDTTILIDEAYHEYVEDPTYASSIPLAMENPRVIVSRTFSKIFGLAGMRVGYAVGQAATIKRLEKERLPSAVNVLGATAALASLNDAVHLDKERALNHAVKEFTRSFFEKAGYRVVPSHTNFIMVDIRRDSKQFQDACRKRDILVGRPFPPLTTLARVSLGTMDEMRRASDIFKSVLSIA